MTSDRSPLESEVLAADEARYQALYAQEASVLARMLVENYVHIHANGKIDDKEAFLASIEAAKYRFINAERTGQLTRVIGPVALLSGRTKTTLEVAGEVKVMNNAFVTVWTREHDVLKLVHWQATKLLEG